MWNGGNPGFGMLVFCLIKGGNFCSETESLYNVYLYNGGQINYKHLQCLRTSNLFMS